MSKIFFKKKVDRVIYLSDVREKYELSHSYFSFLDKELPIDSWIFKNALTNKEIVVVKIDEDVNCSIDMSQYYENDDNLKLQEELHEKQDKERVKKVIKKEKENIKKEEKIKKEKEIEIKKKLEKEKIVDILTDEEIFKKF